MWLAAGGDSRLPTKKNTEMCHRFRDLSSMSTAMPRSIAVCCFAIAWHSGSLDPNHPQTYLSG